MWWEYVIAAVALILLVYVFALITGFETRLLTRKTDRMAEDMYGAYADSGRQPRQFARKRGGERTDGGSS